MWRDVWVAAMTGQDNPRPVPGTVALRPAGAGPLHSTGLPSRPSPGASPGPRGPGHMRRGCSPTTVKLSR